jgi:hypothetical protein
MKEQKQHYIPIFYLKQWAGFDGRLCEYSRPYKNVVPKMTHPAGTGYSRGLYTIRDAPPKLADVFENKFLSIADGQAATSLRAMVNEHHVPSGPEKMAWTRFMMSLLYRTPEGVARSFAMIKKYYEEDQLEEFQKEYTERKRPNDPNTLEEFVRRNSERMTSQTMISHLLDIIQSEKVRDKIMAMQWHVGEMRGNRHSLLTSDRPIVMTNGIAYDTSHIVMPLSPRQIFIAANTNEEVAKIKQLSVNGELIAILNDRMGRQARKFVYGTDDRQLRFVENRLGERAACSPFE